ncbi:MAG: rhodanese-like domain-containing protein [Bacteroidetes bacterium]|nr:rhodanese-like domain-containing protein [Bacteroidota bacterium]
MLDLFKSLFKNDAYENLDAPAFLAKMKATPEAVPLDVRTSAEVADGKIEGAVNLDFYDPMFAEQVGKLDKGKTYFVYCRGGVRSANACRTMHGLGFEKLVNLAGGYLSI